MSIIWSSYGDKVNIVRPILMGCSDIVEDDENTNNVHKVYVNCEESFNQLTRLFWSHFDKAESK